MEVPKSPLRRGLLKGLGALGAAAVVNSVLPQSVLAEESPPPEVPNSEVSNPKRVFNISLKSRELMDPEFVARIAQTTQPIIDFFPPQTTFSLDIQKGGNIRGVALESRKILVLIPNKEPATQQYALEAIWKQTLYSLDKESNGSLSSQFTDIWKIQTGSDYWAESSINTQLRNLTKISTYDPDPRIQIDSPKYGTFDTFGNAVVLLMSDPGKVIEEIQKYPQISRQAANIFIGALNLLPSLEKLTLDKPKIRTIQAMGDDQLVLKLAS